MSAPPVLARMRGRINRAVLKEQAAREVRIRENAYFRAQRRGFAPGGELDDWCAAEREIDSRFPPSWTPRGTATANAGSDR
jgi:hypothetical protein